MQAQEPGWTVWLDRVGRIRDVVLVGSGLVYVTGYLARAIHSLELNLGIPPGVQFEYFVAGLLMLAPAAALISGMWGLVLGLRKVGAWMAEPARKPRMKFLIPGAFVLAFVLVAIANLVDSRLLYGITAAVMLSVLLLGAAFAVGQGKSYPNAEDPTLHRGSWLVRRMWMLSQRAGQVLVWFTAMYGVIFVLSVVVALLFAGSVLLRYVPQELGGGKPKCAYLDLAEGRLSSEMKATLVDRGKSTQGSSAVRSKALEIYSSSDPWLVKLPKQPHNMTYRVDKDTVHAIVWCE